MVQVLPIDFYVHIIKHVKALKIDFRAYPNYTKDKMILKLNDI